MIRIDKRVVVLRSEWWKRIRKRKRKRRRWRWDSFSSRSSQLWLITVLQTLLLLFSWFLFMFSDVIHHQWILPSDHDAAAASSSSCLLFWSFFRPLFHLLDSLLSTPLLTPFRKEEFKLPFRTQADMMWWGMNHLLKKKLLLLHHEMKKNLFLLFSNSSSSLLYYSLWWFFSPLSTLYLPFLKMIHAFFPTFSVSQNEPRRTSLHSFSFYQPFSEE